MPKHSPEPWQAISEPDPNGTHSPDRDGLNPVVVRDSNGRSVINTCNDCGCLFISPEDADRIVACVNHLAGIPTSVLEKAAMMGEMFPCKPGGITSTYCEALILLMTGKKCKVEAVEGDDADRMTGNKDLLYGYCPTCGAPGAQRERRLNGNDICEKGHTYPSKDAKNPPPAENSP